MGFLSGIIKLLVKHKIIGHIGAGIMLILFSVFCSFMAYSGIAKKEVEYRGRTFQGTSAILIGVFYSFISLLLLFCGIHAIMGD